MRMAELDAVSELLSADCKKKWLHPEWEDTVQHWKTWLHDMKKKDEKKRQEEEHQKLVSRIITSAQGGAGLLHKKSRNPLIVNEEKNCWRRKRKVSDFWPDVKKRGDNGQAVAAQH